MSSAPEASVPVRPLGCANLVDAEGEPVEPRFPRWAAWWYLLSPPLLSLLLHPELYEQGREIAARQLATTWIHTAAMGGAIHALYAWVMPHVLKRLQRPLLRLVSHGMAIVIGIAAGLGATSPVTTMLFGWGVRRPLWSLYTSLLIATLWVLAMVTYQQLRLRARKVERRAQHARQAALKARLASLMARTNPHFLFNSLNTVAGLIGEDPERAEEAVVRLAELFRYTLDASRQARVSVRQELDAVRGYLEMEALRYADRLHYELEMDDAAAGLRLPPLCVQPLVENAIVHGIDNHGNRTLKVSAQLSDDQLLVTVSDDGPGPGGSSHVGSQTSVADLRQRLQLVYGGRAKLHMSERPSGGCSVVLQLPADPP